MQNNRTLIVSELAYDYATADSTQTTTGDFEKSLSCLMRKIGETSRSYGTDVILVYTPTVMPEADGHIAVQEQPDERTLYQKLCAENGIVFLDLTAQNISAAEELNQLPFGFTNTSPGTGHINRLGLRIFAEGGVQILKEYGVKKNELCKS